MRKRYWIAGAVGLAGAALAAKLLARPRGVEWEDERGSLGHAERSRFAEIDGARVHYVEAGDENAPAVVLLHGLSASNFVWHDALVPLSEEGFRVVAPDLVGSGFSSKPREGDYSIEAQARVVVGLMGALGIDRATLVGSSYGGAVAAVCALDHAQRVSRLVLVGAVANNELKRRLSLRAGTVRGVGELFVPFVMDVRHSRKRRRLRAHAERDGRAYDEGRALAHLRFLKAADAQRAILRTLRQWDAERVEREAEKITQPALLVWGACDRDVPVRHGERLRELIPGSRLVVFESCAHLPQEEYPREFVRLVAEFCRAGDGVQGLGVGEEKTGHDSIDSTRLSPTPIP